MTYKQYLFWMVLMTGLAWFGFASVVRGVDPMTSGLLGLAFFYLLLAFALTGTLAILGLLARTALRPHEAVHRHAASSFRQGMLLSLMVIGALAMHGRGLLTWWTALLFIAGITMAEFFLLSLKMDKR